MIVETKKRVRSSEKEKKKVYTPLTLFIAVKDGQRAKFELDKILAKKSRLHGNAAKMMRFSEKADEIIY